MKITCVGCGKRRTLHGPKLVCSCGTTTFADGTNDGKAPAHVIRRGINYVRAWLRWTAAGCPVREPGEVDAIRETCRACEYFDDQNCTHKKCGCAVAKGNWWGDKVKWATEHCPIEKW